MKSTRFLLMAFVLLSFGPSAYAAITGGVEGAQEAAQNYLQNLIAQGVYKADQELIEGVGEGAAYGAGAPQEDDLRGRRRRICRGVSVAAPALRGVAGWVTAVLAANQSRWPSHPNRSL